MTTRDVVAAASEVVATVLGRFVFGAKEGDLRIVHRRGCKIKMGEERGEDREVERERVESRALRHARDARDAGPD
jgi:hypothetical protein